MFNYFFKVQNTLRTYLYDNNSFIFNIIFLTTGNILMILADFLKEANPDHDLALKAAHEKYITVGSLVPAATFNHWLGACDLSGIVEDVANDKTHPARHKMVSVRNNILGGEPFNFIQTAQTGRDTIAMVEDLINNTLSEYAPALIWLLNRAITYSNEKQFPLAHVTLHDVLVERGVCPLVSVENNGSGYVVITTLKDCPAHRPRLMATNLRTGETIRVNNFYGTDKEGVSKAGKYETMIPRDYLDSALFVDDAYGIF